jgi:hypothetical protein
VPSRGAVPTGSQPPLMIVLDMVDGPHQALSTTGRSLCSRFPYWGLCEIAAAEIGWQGKQDLNTAPLRLDPSALPLSYSPPFRTERYARLRGSETPEAPHLCEASMCGVTSASLPGRLSRTLVQNRRPQEQTEPMASAVKSQSRDYGKVHICLPHGSALK